MNSNVILLLLFQRFSETCFQRSKATRVLSRPSPSRSLLLQCTVVRALWLLSPGTRKRRERAISPSALMTLECFIYAAAPLNAVVLAFYSSSCYYYFAQDSTEKAQPTKFPESSSSQHSTLTSNLSITWKGHFWAILETEARALCSLNSAQQ